jgi:hypothetical protein
MDAELVSGFGQVAAGLGEDPADEPPLELATAVLEMNSAGDHLIDKAIQQFFHGLLGRPQGLRYICGACSAESVGGL